MLFYDIAKLKISVDGGDALSIFPDKMAEYKCAPFESADIRINFCEVFDRVNLPAHTVVFRGTLQTYFEYDGGYGFFMGLENGTVTNLVLADKDWSSIYVELLNLDHMFPDSTGQRLFHTLAYVFETAVLTKNRMVFHSSSIAYKGAGLCFSAASGTGKSTHTGLWLQKHPDAVLVNDDKPILLFENDRVFLCGSPWAGTTGINANLIVPLRAVVCIRRGDENKIYPIDQLTAIHRIIKESPKPKIPSLTPLFMQRVNALISGCEAFMLECTPDTRAVDVAEIALFGE